MDKLQWIFGIENPYKTKLYVYIYAPELVLTFFLNLNLRCMEWIFYLVTMKICAYLSNFASGFPKVPFCIRLSNKGN